MIVYDEDACGLYQGVRYLLGGQSRKDSIVWVIARVSIGLLMYPSQPASRAFSSSPRMAWAVSAMMGIFSSPGFFLMMPVTVRPSMPGNCISIKIRSGASISTCLIASAPVTAVVIVYQLASRMSDINSRFSGLSSTIRMFCLPNDPQQTVNTPFSGTYECVRYALTSGDVKGFAPISALIRPYPQWRPQFRMPRSDAPFCR